MIYFLILTAVFGLDYVVKRYIEKNKSEGQQEKALGGAILIRRMSNYGTAGSYLQNKPQIVKWVSGIALFGMCLSYIRLLFQKGDAALKICLSLILGGGLSNFYDRVKKGAVTDYFSFCVPVKKIRNLIFNISDLFIIIGSVFLLILQFRLGGRQHD